MSPSSSESIEATHQTQIDNDLTRVTLWCLPAQTNDRWLNEGWNHIILPHCSGQIWIETEDGEWSSLDFSAGQALYHPFERARRLYNRGFETLHFTVTEIKIQPFSEAESRAKEETLTQFFEASPLALVLTGLEGIILRANQRAQEVFGMTAQDMNKSNFADFHLNPDDRLSLISTLQADGFINGFETDLKNKQNKEFTVLLSSRMMDYDGQPCFLTGIADISELKRLQTELIRLASTDALTHSYNRRAFMNRAEQEFSRARRYHHPLSVLMLDADHFKRVNDVYGHRFGDMLLQHLVKSCQSCLRQSDLVGRVGGEEFAILLPEAPLDRAQEVAERLRKFIMESEVKNQQGVCASYTVSIGAASLSDANDNFEELLHCADIALYQAKEQGRNRVVSIDQNDSCCPAAED